MVLDRVRQIDCVLLSGDQSEAENVRVVLGLLVEIRRLIAFVPSLPPSDHADSSLSVVFWVSKSSKPRENLHGRGETEQGATSTQQGPRSRPGRRRHEHSP